MNGEYMSIIAGVVTFFILLMVALGFLAIIASASTVTKLQDHQSSKKDDDTRYAIVRVTYSKSVPQPAVLTDSIVRALKPSGTEVIRDFDVHVSKHNFFKAAFLEKVF